MNPMSVASYVDISQEKSFGKKDQKSFKLTFPTDSKSFQFTLPTVPHELDPTEPGILAFRVGPDTAQTNLKFVVRINTKEVFDASLWNSTDFRTFHEVIESGLLLGGANNIDFTMVSGNGSMSFADVVLWFKVKVSGGK